MLPKFVHTRHKQLPEITKSSTWQSFGLITVFYCIAWGGTLLSARAVFWDDWTIVGKTSMQIKQNYLEHGDPLIGQLLVYLEKLGPISYHALIFLMFLVAGFSVFKIMQNDRILNFSPNERLITAIAFVVLPLNASRITLIVFSYSLSNMLFFTGWLALLKNTPKSHIRRLIINTMFILSFLTNSFLVFFLIPVAHLYFIEDQKSVRLFAQKHYDLLILPILFWFIKNTYFAPFGSYANYNKLHLNFLLKAIIMLAIASAPLLLFSRKYTFVSTQFKNFLCPFFLGVCITALGLFPYIAIGLRPPFHEWGNRNELLLPLGFAIIFTSCTRVLKVVFGHRIGRILTNLTLVLMCAVSALYCVSYYFDWQKQEDLITIMEENTIFPSYQTIVFNDQTSFMNIYQRHYRFYEWNGLMKRATGLDSQFGINDSAEEKINLESGFYKECCHNIWPINYEYTRRALLVQILPMDENKPWNKKIYWLRNFTMSRISMRVEFSAFQLD